MKFAPPQLRSEDFPDLQGDRLVRLIRALNALIAQATAVLSRGLTLGDNVACAVREVTLRSLPAKVEIEIPGKRRPGLVLVGRCEDVTSPSTPVPVSVGAPGWTAGATSSGHTLTLHAIDGLEAGRAYRLKLLVFPE